MESWENKIIQEKLDSLQDLPEGYLPDLSSKWEIVNAGLPAKRRWVPVFVKWSVAAAVLLGVYITYLQLNNDKQSEHTTGLANHLIGSNLSSTMRVNVRIKATMPAPVELTITTMLAVNKNSNPQQAFAKSNVVQFGREQEPVLRDTTKSIASVISSANMESKKPSDDTSAHSVSNELAVTPLLEKSKPAKRKVYQRDFDDGVLVMDTGYTPANSQHFSIQLKPFSRKADAAEQQPARRLQWKQAL
jgi:hypothetical protein